MKKAVNSSIFLSFLICYLEWGKDNSLFIFQMESDILFKAGENFSSVVHPFTLIPFTGQLLLLFTLFQKEPNKKLTIAAWISLSLLVAMILLTGCLGLNYKVILSTLPFVISSVVMFRAYKRKPDAA